MEAFFRGIPIDDPRMASFMPNVAVKKLSNAETVPALVGTGKERRRTETTEYGVACGGGYSSDDSSTANDIARVEAIEGYMLWSGSDKPDEGLLEQHLKLFQEMHMHSNYCDVKCPASTTSDVSFDAFDTDGTRKIHSQP
jgi:hypothetical protein